MARVLLGNIKGPKGEGVPGPKGDPGPLPVKGVDYFTQEDIDSIVAGIVAANVGVESTEHPGCYYRMVNGETEWISPPMAIGVEYRTTERYLGKPIYAKLIDCGGCPGTGSKTITHNEAGVIDRIVSAQGQVDLYRTFPCSVIGGAMKLDFETNQSIIILYSSADFIKDSPCFVLLKYTKM